MESIAIIGAGLTGLTVADALRDTYRVTVFEKSRGLGGRLSTRRVTLDDGTRLSFDHGAPVAHGPTDRDHEVPADYLSFLERLRERGSVSEWDHWPGFAVGVPQMSDLVAPLAEGIDMRVQARVGALAREADGWWLIQEPHQREGGTTTGPEGPFDRVVVAIPAHQAARLLAPHAPDVADGLGTVTMAPCWTLMVAFRDAVSTGLDGVEDRGDVQWLVREADKPGRAARPPRWVLQMKAEWSRRHLHRDRADMVPVLLDVMATLRDERDPMIAIAHRWLHSQTETPLGKPCRVSKDETLIVGGDWCLGPYAQHAWASGRAIVERLR